MLLGLLLAVGSARAQNMDDFLGGLDLGNLGNVNLDDLEGIIGGLFDRESCAAPLRWALASSCMVEGWPIDARRRPPTTSELGLWGRAAGGGRYCTQQHELVLPVPIPPCAAPTAHHLHPFRQREHPACLGAIAMLIPPILLLPLPPPLVLQRQLRTRATPLSSRTRPVLRHAPVCLCPVPAAGCSAPRPAPTISMPCPPNVWTLSPSCFRR